jgi:hypothetical protein
MYNIFISVRGGELETNEGTSVLDVVGVKPEISGTGILAVRSQGPEVSSVKKFPISVFSFISFMT